MKKLIKIDPISGRFTEIDLVKLERTAKALKDYIVNTVDRNSDPYGIWKWVMPLCSKALNGDIKTPMPWSDLPLKYHLREGNLSEDFEEVYASFSIAITASPVKELEIFEVNGEQFAYADIEEK